MYTNRKLYRRILKYNYNEWIKFGSNFSLNYYLFQNQQHIMVTEPFVLENYMKNEWNVTLKYFQKFIFSQWNEICIFNICL